MKIKQSIEKVPGGMMLIPLLIGAIIRTIFPHLADNAIFKSSFTGGLFMGTLPLLAVFFMAVGANMKIQAAGYVVKKGLSMWAGKVLFAALIGVVIRFTVPDQNHMFLGLSALAIIAAFTDTNGGMFMALISQYGKQDDIAAYSIMSLESGPFFTMAILGVAGLASFPIMAFVLVLVPMIVGMILGNLDEDMRTFLGKAQDTMIPMFALSLGFGINLKEVLAAGAGGIILGLAVIVLTGILLWLLDKVTGGNGVTGIAAATTAGNASAVPVAVAASFVGYKSIAAVATTQVAASVIVTAILVPVITGWFARRAQRAHPQVMAGEERAIS
ncbi:2-keto-3-deoxygluconate permease [Alicyclobacillus tolerans]|uniref:2-keto-3-deoxygluconate permease n=1 Tax=Alicyclobacillus tolerans TaxID=90970 RepID=UPI001F2A2F91|nr:2-keto-3-deoxygluconate permease [Alicyclobacillus tolerans]MCF8566854.1 2-keto-3-deoxygluconate permease [Alicyclobacillus tolerans]